jgi:hypothetical protein
MPRMVRGRKAVTPSPQARYRHWPLGLLLKPATGLCKLLACYLALPGTSLTSTPSHAQRDIIDLALIAAAARAGDENLARAPVTERVARKLTAGVSARHLVAENGGSPGALRR